MSEFPEITVADKHSREIIDYYRIHSRLYDATRWSFLFGRKSLINKIPPLPDKPRILEVGCGTGTNLVHLKKRFPDARVTGLDLSPDMLQIARNNMNDSSITLKNIQYGTNSLDEKRFDLILLSYSLTMMGQNYPKIVAKLNNDLHPRGYITIVDFHTSPMPWFRRWMNINHVDLSGNLYPLIKKNFNSEMTSLHNTYFGLWNYFMFIGSKN